MAVKGVHFSLATIKSYNTSDEDHRPYGYAINGSVDISVEHLALHVCGAIYPIMAYPHTGTIAWRASNARLSNYGFQRLIGGSIDGNIDNSTQTINSTSEPSLFKMVFTVTTGSSGNLQITLNSCYSQRLAWEFTRDGFVIPNFEGGATADDDGVVGTIQTATYS